MQPVIRKRIEINELEKRKIKMYFEKKIKQFLIKKLIAKKCRMLQKFEIAHDL